MRKEPFAVGDFVHIVRRGGRGLPIVKTLTDYERLLKVHYYLNDCAAKENWFRDLEQSTSTDLFAWPLEWPDRDSLFELCAFTFLSNHFHLIGLEKIENGISTFMHKSGISISKHHNEKYKERGSLFQGSYRAKRIDSDAYLRWVVPYVLVKNTFEMHPKGYEWAVKNFEDAWQWASTYPYSSLGDYASGKKSPVVNTQPLKDMLGGPREFKQLCKDMILGREEIVNEPEFRTLLFER